MSPETQQSWPATAPGGGQVATHLERVGEVGGGSRLGAGYRRAAAEPPADAEQPNGVAYELPPEKPRLPSLDPEAPPEPQFSVESWLETPAGNLADHPLLRGLLLELPPKGSTPPPGWLDRWFEATRSILELLYIR
jgi:hypothetical protein